MKYWGLFIIMIIKSPANFNDVIFTLCFDDGASCNNAQVSIFSFFSFGISKVLV